MTSSCTGLVFGIDWEQDSYDSDISKSGKKLSVNIYGHFDYYLLIETTLTKISSENKTYSVSWDY